MSLVKNNLLTSKQLKAVLQEMGYDWSQDIVHVPFGLVTKEGKKLSTRKGNVILLEPTAAEAVSRAKAQIEAKNPELENKDQVAHAVGVGAIKFYDLKTDRTNGYDFDLEAMVSFEGGNWTLCTICLRSYPIYLT